MSKSIYCPECGGALAEVGDFCPGCLLASGLMNEPPFRPEIEGFEVLEKLGNGAMGEVWKARQLEQDRLVAIKFLTLTDHGSVERHARFRREIRLASHLRHSNITRVYEVGDWEGTPYFTMEYVDGTRLDEYARGKSVKIILEVVLAVCRGVGYAHQEGILHRDLKPENILVDQEGQPFILDFGLGKRMEVEDAASLSVSLDGGILGSPQYMSPEQAGGVLNLVDERTDVYSIGVILFELLTRRFPHESEKGAMELLRKIREEPPLLPREANRELDGEIEMLLLTALARKKEERYESVEVLGDEIQRYLNHSPLQVGRTSPIYFTRIWARKNWVAMIVVILILGGAATYFVQIFDAKQETQVAKGLAASKVKEGEGLKLNGLVQQADLSAAQGKWREVLARLDEAEEKGFSDGAALGLRRLEAHNALGETDIVVEVLSGLKDQLWSVEDEARILLWRGDTLPVENRRELIERAIELGLPPDEEAYALGLTAAHSVESRRQLQRAVQINPLHPRAGLVLAMTELLLGFHEEAEIRFQSLRLLLPENAAPLVGLAIQKAMLSEVAEGKELLLEAEKLGAGEQVSALSNNLEVIGYFSEWPKYEIFGLKKDRKLKTQLMLKMFQVQNQIGENGRRGGMNQGLLPLQMQGLTRKLTKGFMAYTMRGDTAQTIKEFELLLKDHPEGSLFFILAAFYIDHDDFEGAYFALERGSQAAWMFPSIEAYGFDLMALSIERLAKGEQEKVWLAKTGGIIRERLKHDDPMAPAARSIFAHLALKAGELSLARQMADLGIQESEQLRASFLWAKAKAEMGLGFPEVARKACEDIIALPDDEVELAMREAAEKMILKIGESKGHLEDPEKSDE